MSARIKQIYLYPIKSMGGHTLEEAKLTATGIPGDRCWTLKDEVRGSIKGGKRFAQLMDMQARLIDTPSEQKPSPHAQITLPNGSQVHSSDPDINDRLSQAVGSPVSLWPLLPADQLDHYKRLPADDDTDPQEALRELFARTPEEPLPDLSSFPEELFTYESPPGTYFDAFPLLVMTQSSIDAMQTAAPESNFDVRRFRPNILLEDADEGFIENSWAGRKGRLGEATVAFAMACPRCVMTTHGFADLPKDPKVMRALVGHNDGNLGIYASVVEPGNIRPGDQLELL